MNYIKSAPHRVSVKGYKGSDCTINAIGNSLGISYDLARKLLQTGYLKDEKFSFRINSPRTKNEFTQRGNVRNILRAISTDHCVYISDKEIQNKIQNKKRITSDLKKTGGQSVNKFAESNPKGTFILLVFGHLTAVIDGVLVDTWNCGDYAVEIAYKISVPKARKVIKGLASFYRMDSEKHFIKNHKKALLSKSMQAS